MTLYRLDDPGDLVAPVLIVAFDGWVDAGQAATTVAGRLAEGGDLVVAFDGDALFDYRARRPTLDIVDGTLLDLDWPALTIRRARIDGRDLLVFTGPEPDYRWRQLAEEIVELARRLGVATWISLGAIPAAVAHTRSVPILGTASGPDLLPPDIQKGPDGRLRVPSAALSVLEMAIAAAGIPAIGLFAQVPHYVSGAYPAAALELARRLGRHLAISLPTDGLEAETQEQRILLDTAASSDQRTRQYVERLEAMTDEARLPEGDELISEIERFLRERGGEGRGTS